MSKNKRYVATERFCIYCGIWFLDYLLYCPCCDNYRVSTAQTRKHEFLTDDEVQELIEKYTSDDGDE